jgi:hypothetical protein
VGKVRAAKSREYAHRCVGWSGDFNGKQYIDFTTLERTNDE